MWLVKNSRRVRTTFLSTLPRTATLGDSSIKPDGNIVGIFQRAADAPLFVHSVGAKAIENKSVPLA